MNLINLTIRFIIQDFYNEGFNLCYSMHRRNFNHEGIFQLMHGKTYLVQRVFFHAMGIYGRIFNCRSIQF